MTFDTFADHIFPPGADLQQKTKGKLVNAHVRADSSMFDTGVMHLYVIIHSETNLKKFLLCENSLSST